MKNIRKEFLKKFENDGRKFTWFIKKYLPHMSYYTAYNQITGYSPASQEVKKAMKKYIMKEL